MAETPRKFTSEEIAEAWHSAKFHSMPSEKRIHVMEVMDPSFAGLSGLAKRQSMAQAERQWGPNAKPTAPNPTAPVAPEDVAGQAMRASGIYEGYTPQRPKLTYRPDLPEVNQDDESTFTNTSPFSVAGPSSATPATVAAAPQVPPLTPPVNSAGRAPTPIPGSIPVPGSVPPPAPATPLNPPPSPFQAAAPPPPNNFFAAQSMGSVPPSIYTPTPAQATSIVPPAKKRGEPVEIARKGPYITQLSDQEKPEFLAWVKANNVPFDPTPQADYDMPGYWRAMKLRDDRAKEPEIKRDGPHYPDYWKTPNHKTFSNESIYAAKDAPRWYNKKLIDSYGTVIEDEGAKEEAAKAQEKQVKDDTKVAQSLDKLAQQEQEAEIKLQQQKEEAARKLQQKAIQDRSRLETKKSALARKNPEAFDRVSTRGPEPLAPNDQRFMDSRLSDLTSRYKRPDQVVPGTERIGGLPGLPKPRVEETYAPSLAQDIIGSAVGSYGHASGAMADATTGLPGQQDPIRQTVEGKLAEQRRGLTGLQRQAINKELIEAGMPDLTRKGANFPPYVPPPPKPGDAPFHMTEAPIPQRAKDVKVPLNLQMPIGPEARARWNAEMEKEMAGAMERAKNPSPWLGPERAAKQEAILAQATQRRKDAALAAVMPEAPITTAAEIAGGAASSIPFMIGGVMGGNPAIMAMGAAGVISDQMARMNRSGQVIDPQTKAQTLIAAAGLGSMEALTFDRLLKRWQGAGVIGKDADLKAVARELYPRFRDYLKSAGVQYAEEWLQEGGSSVGGDILENKWSGKKDIGKDALHEANIGGASGAIIDFMTQVGSSRMGRLRLKNAGVDPDKFKDWVNLPEEIQNAAQEQEKALTAFPTWTGEALEHWGTKTPESLKQEYLRQVDVIDQNPYYKPEQVSEAKEQAMHRYQLSTILMESAKQIQAEAEENHPNRPSRGPGRVQPGSAQFPDFAPVKPQPKPQPVAPAQPGFMGSTGYTEPETSETPEVPEVETPEVLPVVPETPSDTATSTPEVKEELYRNAVAAANQYGQFAVGTIKGHLDVDWPTAFDLVSRMEKEGLVRSDERGHYTFKRENKPTTPTVPTTSTTTPPASPEETGKGAAGAAGEAAAGFGRGMTEGIYQGLWEKLQAGETTEAGQPSTVLQVAKKIKERGGMKAIGALRGMAQEVAKAKETLTGEAFQKEMHAIVERYSPKYEPPAAPDLPSLHPQMEKPQDPFIGAHALVERFHQMLLDGKQMPDMSGLNKIAEEVTGQKIGSGMPQRYVSDALDVAQSRYYSHPDAMAKDRSPQEVQETITGIRKLREGMPEPDTRWYNTNEAAKRKYNSERSTTPEVAYVAALAADIQQGETVLDPSAGNGMLAGYARAAGGNVVTNEKNMTRRGLLGLEGYQTHGNDAEHLDTSLPKDVAPSVILMAPPQSDAKPHHPANQKLGFAHVTAAAHRLAPGGRLVAVLGPDATLDNQGARKFHSALGKFGTVVASVGIAADGTHPGKTILIYDKVSYPKGEAPDPIQGYYNSVEEAYEDALQRVPKRDVQDRSGEADTGGLHPVRGGEPGEGGTGSRVPQQSGVAGTGSVGTGTPLQPGGTGSASGNGGRAGTATGVQSGRDGGGRQEGVLRDPQADAETDTGTPGTPVASKYKQYTPEEIESLTDDELDAMTDAELEDLAAQKLAHKGFTRTDQPTAPAATAETETETKAEPEPAANRSRWVRGQRGRDYKARGGRAEQTGPRPWSGPAKRPVGNEPGSPEEPGTHAPMPMAGPENAERVPGQMRRPGMGDRPSRWRRRPAEARPTQAKPQQQTAAEPQKSPQQPQNPPQAPQQQPQQQPQQPQAPGKAPNALTEAAAAGKAKLAAFLGDDSVAPRAPKGEDYSGEPQLPKPKNLPGSIRLALADIGGEKILGGLTKFKDWAAEMTADLGKKLPKLAGMVDKKVDQFLYDLYNSARNVAKKFGIEADEADAPAADEPEAGTPDEKAKREALKDDGSFTEVDNTVLPAEWDAQPHKAKIVESQSMAGVKGPPITVKPNIDQALISAGKISAIQLIAVARAVAAFGQQIGDKDAGFKRAAYFIGDGTGLGKGREITAVLLHLWNSGVRRIIWTSYNEQLMNDARRDLKALGVDIPMRWIGDFEAGKDINPKKMEDGIIFTSYASLGSVSEADKEFIHGVPKDKNGQPVRKPREYPAGYIPYQRVRQLTKWAGDTPFFAFDEAHKAKNAAPDEGASDDDSDADVEARPDSSYAGQATLAIQDAVPQAHVLYSSATGFTEPENLVYASRLGLWGPGSQFKTFADFHRVMKKGGISAMEMVALGLKGQGRYESRFISYGKDERGVEVEFDEVSHKVTPAQQTVLDNGIHTWHDVRQSAAQAILWTKAPKKEANKTTNQFYGALMRYNMGVQTSMKLPALFNIIDMALPLKVGQEERKVDQYEDSEGNQQDRANFQEQIVISVLLTNEAATERQLERKDAEGLELKDLDLSPAMILKDYILKFYPIHEWEVYKDEEGKAKDRIKRDENGEMVVVKKAKEARDKLLEEVETMKLPDSAIDQIISRYGADQVAELTGRARRIETDPKTGERTVVDRDDDNKPEMNAFQNGKKRIAIISPASSTGISLHADNNAVNRGRRRHIVLQLMWSADQQMQVFGRTHRTNQWTPPHYTLMTMNVGGEKRFASSIARRLAQLGALSRGDRSSNASGTIADYNFETPYGRQAVHATMAQIVNKHAFGGNDTLRMMGFDKWINKQWNTRSNLKVPKFLNRIQLLPMDTQNEVFGAFDRAFRDIIDEAKRKNTFDNGAEKLKADRINLAEKPTLLRTDPVNGAKTYLYKLNLFHKRDTLSWDQVQDFVDTKGWQLLQQPQTKNLVLRDKSQREMRDNAGNPTGYGYNLIRTNGDYLSMHTEEMNRRYVPVTMTPELGNLWEKQVAKHDEYKKEVVHMVGGEVLSVYGTFMGTKAELEAHAAKQPKAAPPKTKAGVTKAPEPEKKGTPVLYLPQVRIANLENKQRILGIRVEPGRLQGILKEIGYDMPVTPHDMLANLASPSAKALYTLKGGVTLHRGSHNKQPAIVVSSPSDRGKEFIAMGVTESEYLRQKRYVIPLVGEEGESNAAAAQDVLNKLIEAYPPIGDQEGNINFAPADPNRVVAEGYDDTHIDAGVEPGARKPKPDRRGPARKVADAIKSRFTRGRKNADATDAGEAPKVGKKTEAKEESKAEKTDEAGTSFATHDDYLDSLARTELPSTALPKVAVSRQDIVDDLRKKIKNMPIRIGNLNKPAKVAGIYKRWVNLIRLRKALNLPVLSHELGHAVQKFIWGIDATSAEWNNDVLEPFANELMQLDYDEDLKAQGEGRLQEGFAEYMRYWLTEPTSAERVAPRFHNWFQGVLSRNQELESTLQDARQKMLTWFTQPSAIKIGSAISVNPRQSTHPEDRSWKEKLGEKANSFEYHFIDDLVDLRKAVEKLTAHGAMVADTANGYLLARKATASYTRAKHALTDGTLSGKTHEISGESLQAILKPMSDRPRSEWNKNFERIAKEWNLEMANDGLDDLRLYITARRMKDYELHGLETGFTEKQVDEAIGATSTPAVRNAAARLHKYSDRILDYMVDKGALSKESREAIFESNSFYVPLYRVMDDRTSRALPGRRMIDLGLQPAKRKGSAREVVDPLESIIRNTYAFYSYADRMQVVNKLVEQAERAQNAGYLVEQIVRPAKRTHFNLKDYEAKIRDILGQRGIDLSKLKDDDFDIASTIFRPNYDPDRSQGIVRAIIGGKMKMYHMDPDLIRALDGMDRNTADAFVPLLSQIKNLLTFTATAGNPEFITTNWWKDQWTAGAQSNNGYIPILSGIRGFMHLYDEKKVRDWETAGGSQGAMKPLTRTNLRRDLDSLTMSRWTRDKNKNYFFRHPSQVFSVMRDMLTWAGDKAEKSTRMAEYQLALKAGKSRATAAQESRDVTLDFSRMGKTARFLNSMIPFFGVTLNAAERFWKMHKNPETRWHAVKFGLVGITVPTILHYALIRDDKEYEAQEQWLKDLYWLIPTKGMGSLARKIWGPFMRLPKPPIWGQVYGTSVQRTLDMMDKANPDAFDEFLERLTEQVIPDLSFAATRPWQEIEANYNQFTNRPIESPQLQKYSEHNRYHPSTAKWAVAMSKAMHDWTGMKMSPVKAEHFFLGHFAGLGRMGTFLGEEATGARKDRPAPSPSDIPILRSWATREVPYISSLYKKLQEVTVDLEQRNTDFEKERGKPLSGAEEGKLTALLNIRTNLSRLHKQAAAVEASKTLDRTQKRDELNRLAHQREKILDSNRKLFMPPHLKWVEKLHAQFGHTIKD